MYTQDLQVLWPTPRDRRTNRLFILEHITNLNVGEFVLGEFVLEEPGTNHQPVRPTPCAPHNVPLRHLRTPAAPPHVIPVGVAQYHNPSNPKWRLYVTMKSPFIASRASRHTSCFPPTRRI